MKHFTSLEQRVIHSYLDTFPPFHPSPSLDLSEQEQNDLYDFAKNIWERLFADPGILFHKLHPDFAFQNRFNASADNQPAILSSVRAIYKKLEDLCALLHTVAYSCAVENGRLIVGEGVKIGMGAKNLLENCGILIKNEGKTLSFWCEIGSKLLEN